MKVRQLRRFTSRAFTRAPAPTCAPPTPRRPIPHHRMTPAAPSFRLHLPPTETLTCPAPHHLRPRRSVEALLAATEHTASPPTPSLCRTRSGLAVPPLHARPLAGNHVVRRRPGSTCCAAGTHSCTHIPHRPDSPSSQPPAGIHVLCCRNPLLHPHPVPPELPFFATVIGSVPQDQG
jgi:hypothetical protein